MAGIQNTTQKKFFLKSLVFVCVTALLFFINLSFAHAEAVKYEYSGMEEWILNLGLGIGGFFAGLGGLMFDGAINYLVLQMGDWYINRGLGTVVNSIWTMIRDLFNILFIFSLVYIGLRTIWDADDSRTKKLLGSLIAAALLINFSLYIAKVIVDISNFTAIQVYKTATGGITGTFGITGDVVNYITGKASLSGAYMQVLSVTSWFDGGVPNGSVFVYSIVAMLFLMFLGFVLAYGALMLTARFIAIIFYLMFSPFMFLGWVLPQFQSFATKWWKGFLGYSFYAPVYIFMLYIGLFSLQQIKTGFGDQAGFSSFTDSFAKSTPKTVDTFSIFLLFAIGTGFLIGATKVASMMSNGGAAIGMGAMDKLSKKVIPRVDKSTASWMYRNTGGRIAGGALATMDRLDRSLANAQETNAKRKWYNPRKLVTGAALSAGREVAGGTTTRGAVEGARNYGAGVRGRKQVEDDMKAQNERTTKANKAAKLKHTIKNGTPEQKEGAWKKYSTTEIDEMAKTSKGKTSLLENAAFLTDAHMKKLESDHPELHTKIKKKRKDDTKQQFRATPSTAFTKTNGVDLKSDKEIAKLDSAILTDIRSVPYLNAKVLHHIFKDTDMSDADRTTIRNHVTAAGAPIDPAVLAKVNTWLNSTEGRLF